MPIIPLRWFPITITPSVIAIIKQTLGPFATAFIVLAIIEEIPTAIGHINVKAMPATLALFIVDKEPNPIIGISCGELDHHR